MLFCLVSFFEHGHFTHAQNIESFKIGEALDTLSFVMKSCQHPSIKLPNAVSSGSQLKLKLMKGAFIFFQYPNRLPTFHLPNRGKLETHG
jgi:hypothetical protein